MKNLKVKMQNLKLRKDDLVQVMLGKDNGKSGKVLRVDRKSGRALVEGVNMVKRHVRSMQGMEGGIVKISKSVDMSNLQIICSKCKKITRVGFKIEGSSKQRICKKCKEII